MPVLKMKKISFAQRKIQISSIRIKAIYTRTQLSNSHISTSLTFSHFPSPSFSNFQIATFPNYHIPLPCGLTLLSSRTDRLHFHISPFSHFSHCHIPTFSHSLLPPIFKPPCRLAGFQIITFPHSPISHIPPFLTSPSFLSTHTFLSNPKSRRPPYRQYAAVEIPETISSIPTN